MTNVSGVAAEQLESLIQRIERLNSDKANISADIREVFAEAAEGNSPVVIAGILGFTPRAIQRRLANEFKSASFWTDARKVTLRSLAESGMNLGEICDEMGKSESSISQMAAKLGVSIDRRKEVFDGPEAIDESAAGQEYRRVRGLFSERNYGAHQNELAAYKNAHHFRPVYIPVPTGYVPREAVS